jgi:2'-5' RNA ligase
MSGLPKIIFAKPYITAPSIAVDFDGTLQDERGPNGELLKYPDIGKPMEDVIKKLRVLKNEGWRIIIFTCRTSVAKEHPEDALAQQVLVRNWLDEHAVPFDEVWPFPKPFADIFLDDKSINPTDFVSIGLGEESKPVVVPDFQHLPTVASLSMSASGKPNFFFVGDFFTFSGVGLLSADEPKEEFACLMLDYPEDFAKEVRKWTEANVPDEALAEDGREAHIHTTVAYGIALDQDPEVIKEVVKGSVFNPKVRLGKIEKFDTNPDYDALKVGVESPDLHKLHAALEAMGLPGNTYPDYKPHMTLAYVKKGSCDHLMGQDPFGGKEFTLSNYDLSYASHDKGDHIHFKAGICRPWMIAAEARLGTRIWADNMPRTTPMSEMDCIQELLSWLEDSGHEVVTRYGTGSAALPDRATMCRGDCEGTGVVPINFKEPAPGTGYFVYSDEDEKLYHDPWERAQAESPAADGWQFLTCPDCGGTGKRSQKIKVGDPFSWNTLGGDKFSGTVTETDNESVYVACTDGVTRCTGLSLAEMGRDPEGNVLKAADFSALQKACRALVEEDPKWTGYLTNPAVAESLGQVQEAISRARTPEDLQRAWQEFRPSTTWEQVESRSESTEKEPVAAGLRPILFVKI